MLRTLETELAQPKYSHFERERRWLVDAVSVPDLDACQCVLIEDRYLDKSRLRLRRMTDQATGTVALKLTKKYDAGPPTARPIVTAYLDEAEYALFAGLPGAGMIKRRYELPYKGRGWSLDLFESPVLPFAILEIEAAETELDALTPPTWAGHEVTDDPRYSCANLLRSGPPTA